MQSISNYFKHPARILLALNRRYGSYIFSDKLYLQIRYRLEMGERLNLDNPQKFTEKIQWLKLYNRKPEYTTMVDKHAVKQYVADRIGSEYIIPTLGVWKRPEDIDFDSLPDQFVLKTTHGGGGGGVVICKDKATFDRQKAIVKLNKSMHSDIYRYCREWPYKNVPRRIIAEQYMEDTKLHELRDYKFFCFGGECRCMKVDFDRFIKHRANYYDPKGNLLHFGEDVCLPDFDKPIEMPANMPKMVELANALSQQVPLLRVDFYDVNGKIYFGEITFYPASGFGTFTPREWDYRLGQYINLPETKIR